MRRPRRHWTRELTSAVNWTLSPWVDKGDNGKGRLSQFRLLLFLFGLAYVWHWPEAHSWEGVALAAVIIFALPIRDLFGKVPVSEAMGALRAVFEAMMSKQMSGIGKPSGHVYSEEEK